MHHEESLVETALVWMLAGMLVSVFALVKIGAFKPGNHFNDAISEINSLEADFAEEQTQRPGEESE